MARRNHVERVRDKLGALLHIADGMERGEPNEDIEAAVEFLRRATHRLDKWLREDFRNNRKPKWTKISENCVIRKKTKITYEA